MTMWAVRWTTPEIINTVFLIVTTLITLAVPIFYGWKANLRDPLARAILAGTGATGVVFLVSTVALFAIHLGWKPSPDTLNWISRALYTGVSVGKLALLLALLKVMREAKVYQATEARHDAEDAARDKAARASGDLAQAEVHSIVKRDPA